MNIQVGPHPRRHALANAGMRLDVLQTILGYEDISTTRRSYAQHTPDAIVMEQLAKAEQAEATRGTSESAKDGADDYLELLNKVRATCPRKRAQ